MLDISTCNCFLTFSCAGTSGDINAHEFSQSDVYLSLY